MFYVISLEKLTDLRLNLWSHDVLGVVSSTHAVPKVLLDLTLQQFPEYVESEFHLDLLLRLQNAFWNRKDKNYFKYTVEDNNSFKGNFYVELVPKLD
jgi:hypothetical protein